MLLTSACGLSTPVPDTGAISATQHDWKKLTAAADAALKRGDKAEAEQNYKAAMTEAEQLAAGDPAREQTTANLANFYYVQGAGGQADALYRGSLARHEKMLGMEHVDLTADLLGLARVSSSEKKYADACSFYGRAIAILKKAGRSVPTDVEADFAEAQRKNGAASSQ